MKAIITKYMGPTDFKGSRIKAHDDEGHSVTIGYPYELSGEAVYKEAAVALCKKMGWPCELLGGGTKNGYVFVFKNQ